MTNETTQDAVESTELVNDIQHVATPAKKTAPKKVAKKTAKKAPAKAAKKTEVKGKKTPAKKATKAAPAAKAEKNGKVSVLDRVITYLSKHDEVTFPDLKKGLNVNDISFSALNNEFVFKKKYEGQSTLYYTLSAAGKKEAAKLAKAK